MRCFKSVHYRRYSKVKTPGMEGWMGGWMDRFVCGFYCLVCVHWVPPLLWFTCVHLSLLSLSLSSPLSDRCVSHTPFAPSFLVTLFFIYLMLLCANCTAQHGSLCLISPPVSDCFAFCLCSSLWSKLSVSHTQTSDSNLSSRNVKKKKPFYISNLLISASVLQFSFTSFINSASFLFLLVICGVLQTTLT